jgi:hypothetical protein
MCERFLSKNRKASVYTHTAKSTGVCILKVMIYDKKYNIRSPLPLSKNRYVFMTFVRFLICVLYSCMSHKPGLLPSTDIDAPIKVYNIPSRVLLLINETRNLVL